MSDYVRPRKYGGESKIIESLKRLEKSINVETSKGDNALFKRSIIIQTGKVTINADDLDMEFDVEFDDDTETNESEITVYNLSDTTIQNIKKGEKLTLTAGYKEDTGIILSGFISQVKTSFDDLDKVTIIKVVDSAGGAEREIKDLAFAKGLSASKVLRKLIEMTKLPLAVFSIQRDFVYKDGLTINDGLMETIKKQAQVCGVSAYVNKGQVYVQPLSKGEDVNFSLTVDTGLISLSEFEEEITAEKFTDAVKGYEITMLLQHRISTGSILNIQSKNVSGRYRVREGQHTYDGSDFLTKVKAIECPQTQATKSIDSKTKGLPDLSKYKGVSIVDALASVGIDSSFAYRKTLAQKLGIMGYSGTAKQNLDMIRKLGGRVK
nr:MAG TPA: major tail protein [Caudoviricetes sp.]